MVVDFARQRLQAFLKEVDDLEQCEFPFSQHRKIVDLLRDWIRERVIELDKLDRMPAETRNRELERIVCADALKIAVSYLPVLGSFRSSTDVRNPFEVVSPLARIGTSLLKACYPDPDSSVTLLLSCEWSYSPFIYMNIPVLPGFALIGLPATESTNSLVVPLAGHELGHLLWYAVQGKDGLADDVRERARSCVNRVLTSKDENERAIVAEFATKQAEESFCDFVGLRLFGGSYLFAFAYLLSPILPGSRSFNHPDLPTRAENLKNAADAYDVEVPPDFIGTFGYSSIEGFMPSETEWLKAADDATKLVVPSLIKDAKKWVDQSGVVLPDVERAKEIRKYFDYAVPAPETKCLADILNAAWLAFVDPNFWRKKRKLREQRAPILRELVLKNIEIFEMEQMIKGGAR